MPSVDLEDNLEVEDLILPQEIQNKLDELNQAIAEEKFIIDYNRTQYRVEEFSLFKSKK